MFSFYIALLLVQSSIICFGRTVESHKADLFLLKINENIDRVEIEANKFQNSTETLVTGTSSIEFDANKNCIFWAGSMADLKPDLKISFTDRIDFKMQNDVIQRRCKHNLNDTHEIFEFFGLGMIESMAFDWMSQILYFVNSQQHTINALNVSYTSGNSRARLYRTIIEAGPNLLLTNVLVHPERGYLFWTAWYQVNGKSTNSSIYRANLDGSGVELLISAPLVNQSTGLTIDYEENRLYWIDDSLKYLASCDLNGNDFRIRSTFDANNPVFASDLSVYQNLIYFRERPSNSDKSRFVVIDKFDGANVTIMEEGQYRTRYSRVYGKESQQGLNVCGRGEHNCSHICVGAPNGKFICLCPDGLNMNADGKCVCHADNEFECFKKVHTCKTDEFQCTMFGNCIPSSLKCDKIVQCSDFSDEALCHYNQRASFKNQMC